MKTFTANYQNEINKNVSTIAGCVRLVREDGQIFRYTDHDQNIVIDTGGSIYDGTYESTYYFSPTAFSFNTNLAVDNFDITNIIDNDIVKEVDVVKEIYTNAEVWYFSVNYNTDVVTALDGINKIFHGYIGQISLNDKTFVAEIRSQAGKLNKNVGYVYSKTCRTTLGSPECGVDLNTAAFTKSLTVVGGTVGEATGSRKVIEADTGFADNYFQYGTLTWTSGLNTGKIIEVKRNLLTGAVIELFLDTLYDIKYGDTFDVTVGCNRLLLGSDGTTDTGDCKTKYSNAINFRGEAYIPSDDILIGGTGVVDYE